MSSVNPDEFDERWQELKRRFIERLQKRGLEIQASWTLVCSAKEPPNDDPDDEPKDDPKDNPKVGSTGDRGEALSTLFHAVHSLAGSGATFGFLELSGAARALEPLIDPRADGQLDRIDQRQAEVEGLLNALAAEMRRINPQA